MIGERPDHPIPFSKVEPTGEELLYIEECIRSGALTGNGPFTRRCESLLQRILGTRKAVLTTSCTDALEMAALLLDIRPGDEVLMPSFTFVSTANAFVLRGAVPVFVDVREDTLNIDETKLERLITPRTRVIVPVHYAGVSCEMDRILEIARVHKLAVVEDAAQAVTARYHDRCLGTLGDLGALSFHGTKNCTCGEGGALLVNVEALEERTDILREKGTDRSKFIRGMIDKYTWVDIGSSYLISDLLAAFLLAQLEHASETTRRRGEIYLRYRSALEECEREGLLKLPVIPRGCESNYHIFHILLPTEGKRNAVMKSLGEAGVQATFHYIPLHESPMGRRFCGEPRRLPVTEDISRRILRLPIYPGLKKPDQDRVVWLLARALKY